MNASEIPDSTVVYAEGFGETTAGALRALRPEYITTKKAEEMFSYRRETWAGWASAGLIEGARHDRMWRLPVKGCRSHLRQLTTPRRRPRAPTSTQAARAWPQTVPAR